MNQEARDYHDEANGHYVCLTAPEQFCGQEERDRRESFEIIFGSKPVTSWINDPGKTVLEFVYSGRVEPGEFNQRLANFIKLGWTVEINESPKYVPMDA